VNGEDSIHQYRPALSADARGSLCASAIADALGATRVRLFTGIHRPASYRYPVPANLLSKNDKGRSGFGNDNTHYPYPCRRRHDRAVTGLWLASLHDGKRGTCQVSQGASYLARHQPLLDVRGSARAFATTRTRGSAPAYLTTRTHGRADASLTTRNRYQRHRRYGSAMSIFAM
jgi:hypothetical protein